LRGYYHGDEVRDFRCASLVEAPRRILQRSVDIRDTFMLAQVVQPRIYVDHTLVTYFDESGS
jgi:hypothetical protein